MAFNLANEVKRAAVRRIVYVLIALLLTMAGIGRAEARTATAPACTVKETTTCTSKAQAVEEAQKQNSATYAALQYGNVDSSGYADWVAQTSGAYTTMNAGTEFEFITQAYKDCAPNNYCPGVGTIFFYWKPKDCETEPVRTESYSFKGSRPTSCIMGCLYSPSGCSGVVVDGFEYTTCTTMTPTGASCSDDDDSEPPPPDGDGDGSSDGNDGSPNNPGEGGGGKDGKPNQDGSGGGSNDDGSGSGNGNTSGGGGSCAGPPSSSGDAILAQIAYQTWATRCAVEKGFAGANGTGNSGGGTGGGTGGGGSGNGDEINDFPFNEGSEPDHDTEEVEDSVDMKTPDFVSMLDTSGFIGGGGCPSFGAINMGRFGTHSLGGEWFCNWLPIMRALILWFGAYTAIRILLGGNL